MRYVLALILMVIWAGVVRAGSDEKSKQFWSWFTQQAPTYGALFNYDRNQASQDDQVYKERGEQAVKDVAAHLKQVHLEFSPLLGSADGTNSLVITVHGQRESFAEVENFVSSAPSIPGWKFVALKPPLNNAAGFEVQAGSASFKFADVRYRCVPTGDKGFDYTIFVPAQVSSDPTGYRQLCTRLLEDLLGEQLAATSIHNVEVRSLDAMPQNDLHPFVDVHRDIASRTAAK